VPPRLGHSASVSFARFMSTAQKGSVLLLLLYFNKCMSKRAVWTTAVSTVEKHSCFKHHIIIIRHVGQMNFDLEGWWWGRRRMGRAVCDGGQTRD
jgi:hypothetical protein